MEAYSEICVGVHMEFILWWLESSLGSISQAFWECAIESNWECIVKPAWGVQFIAIWRVLQSTDGSTQYSASGSFLSSCMMHDE